MLAFLRGVPPRSGGEAGFRLFSKSSMPVAIGVVVLFVAGYEPVPASRCLRRTDLTDDGGSWPDSPARVKANSLLHRCWGVLVRRTLQALGISGVLESNWLVRHAARWLALEVVLLRLRWRMNQAA